VIQNLSCGTQAVAKGRARKSHLRLAMAGSPRGMMEESPSARDHQEHVQTYTVGLNERTVGAATAIPGRVVVMPTSPLSCHGREGEYN